MASKTYQLIKEFKNLYPLTISWFRVKKHTDLIDKSLNETEEVKYAFVGQWDEHDGDWFDTAVCAVTNERIIIAQDRLLSGYRVISVSPKFFNDVHVGAGIIWGFVKIDTMKELIEFNRISKKAVLEIKKNISLIIREYKGQNLSDEKEDTNENS